MESILSRHPGELLPCYHPLQLWPSLGWDLPCDNAQHIAAASPLHLQEASTGEHMTCGKTSATHTHRLFALLPSGGRHRSKATSLGTDLTVTHLPTNCPFPLSTFCSCCKFTVSSYYLCYSRAAGTSGFISCLVAVTYAMTIKLNLI